MERPTPKARVTVGILTFTSSIRFIEAVIRSAADFDEVIVCDGGSIDGTRELARSLGCTVIDQAAEFIDANGRLINEAGVNDQILAAARNDWVFFLDHDELATPELAAEMRAIADGPRQCGAYQIPRLYTIDGTVITCASGYPRYMTRLVHRDAAVGYGGIVHASVVLREGERTEVLDAPMLVPLPPQRELWRRWRGWLRLEEANKASLSRAEWSEQVARPQWKLAKWTAWRTWKVRRTCSGPRLPLRYEVSRVLGDLLVIVYTGRRFVGWRRPEASRAWR